MSTAKYAGMVHRQQAARAAGRRLTEARRLVESALWNLCWNDDPALGNEPVRCVWREMFRRLQRALGDED
jgi:hypothetical protein